jgi:regulator of RNase E activity RraA
MPERTAKLRNWCERLEKIFVPAVADVMDGLGKRNQCLRAGFWPLLPEAAVAGPAFTVREVAASTIDPRSTAEKLRIFAEFFGALKPDQVVMVDTGGCFDAAAWGELMSTITRYTCGAKAAVVDGAIRDVSRILKINFPVWYINRVPTDSEGRLQLLDFNRPIRCGGVQVNPGDIVFADPDGIIVLPADGSVDIEAVISKAEEIVVLEDKTRAELRDGAAVVDVFHKYGRL